jgi:hypothetical protein
MDGAAGDIGTLNEWSLVVTYEEEPTPEPPQPFVGTYDVNLMGAAAVDVAAPGDSVLWSFTIGNNSDAHETYGLSFRADVPDALSIDEVLVTLGDGTVRPLEDGTVWVDIVNIPPSQSAIVQIETTVEHASEVCITGSVVEIAYTACITVLPGELPDTGDLPARWAWVE